MLNTAFQEKDSHYYVRLKWWMLPLIKDGPNSIMDLGCASGVMGNKLLESGKAKEVYGVEIFEAAAAEASKTYKQVFTGDIETMDLDFKEKFDYVICGDILEHLKDPYTVTSRIYKWLKPGGSIFICVPNVRSHTVLRPLILHGKWEYVDAGIMDRTHMRFFTRSSCRAMIENAGFQTYHEEMIISGRKKNALDRVTFRLFEEFLGDQLFCCGRKPGGGSAK
jgi:2-polyprenyl-3-methyl-5-hydroxy-6-metoxy-1,4-benzoquinol methylase